MTTVLIILLAYPVTNVVLNILAGVLLTYLYRKGDELISSLLFGTWTLKFVLYPAWIKAFYWIARLTVATMVCMARGRWYP